MAHEVPAWNFELADLKENQYLIYQSEIPMVTYAIVSNLTPRFFTVF